MKEIGFFQLTLIRWATYFLLLSLFNKINAHYFQDLSLYSAFHLYIGSFLLALIIPLLLARRRKRKVFIHDLPATDG
jgi:hypothetical protein